MKLAQTRIEGKHVLAGLVTFFGVVIAVNMTLAVLASTSWTGLSVENGYVASQRFNAELAEARRQAEFGWKVDFGYSEERLEIALADASGQPLTDFAVRVELERPSTDKEDRHVALVETRPGVYAAAGALKAGQWDADVIIRDSAGRSMRRIYRFVVENRS